MLNGKGPIDHITRSVGLCDKHRWRQVPAGKISKVYRDSSAVVSAPSSPLATIPRAPHLTSHCHSPTSPDLSPFSRYLASDHPADPRYTTSHFRKHFFLLRCAVGKPFVFTLQDHNTTSRPRRRMGEGIKFLWLGSLRLEHRLVCTSTPRAQIDMRASSI